MDGAIKGLWNYSTILKKNCQATSLEKILKFAEQTPQNHPRFTLNAQSNGEQYWKKTLLLIKLKAEKSKIIKLKTCGGKYWLIPEREYLLVCILVDGSMVQKFKFLIFLYEMIVLPTLKKLKSRVFK